MNIHHMRKVLTKAGEGRLRKLSKRQKREMTQLRHRGTMLSALVGFVCTILPAATENVLCYVWEVDGVKDAYWKW